MLKRWMRYLAGKQHADVPMDCEATIRWVAASIRDEAEFPKRASVAAQRLGPTAILELMYLFHSESTPPAELADRFPGLGDWMAARQFAIFEILYVLGEPSLPALREVAFGEYDWTQGNAIEILCRLAADGMQREAIIEELKRELPHLREEALLYAFGPLLWRAKTNASLLEVIDELSSVPEVADARERLLKRK